MTVLLWFHMEQTISEGFSDKEKDAYKMLVKYHNNLKSIGNTFKGKNEGLTILVYEVAKEIKEHLKKFERLVRPVNILNKCSNKLWMESREKR